MQTGDGHAAIVVEPDDHSISGRTDSSVIGRGNAVAIATARDNEKRLERTGLQILAYLRSHICSDVECDL